MVLVLLGTQVNDFSSLLVEVEKLVTNGTIDEEVIVQKGVTKYQSNKMQSFDLIPKDQIEYYKEQANYIITHGGVGSILSSIKMGKKVIAVPRLKEYGEHVNNHQLQIVEKFAEQGYIIGVTDLSKLEEAVKGIPSFLPKEYKSNTDNMIDLIDKFINS